MPDLEDFVAGATAQMGFGKPGPESEPEPVEELDEEIEQDEVEIDDPEYEALAAAFWQSLGPKDRAAAEGSERVRALLWESFVASEGDGDDEEAADFAPQSPADVVRWATANEAALRAAGWEDAAHFLVTAAADSHWWVDTAMLMGWDASIRPTSDMLSRDLSGRVTEASIPGARALDHDPMWPRGRGF